MPAQTINCRVRHGKVARRFQVTDYDDFLETVRSRFGVDMAEMKLEYVDDERDPIMVDSAGEFDEAVRLVGTDVRFRISEKDRAASPSLAKSSPSTQDLSPPQSGLCTETRSQNQLSTGADDSREFTREFTGTESRRASDPAPPTRSLSGRSAPTFLTETARAASDLSYAVSGLYPETLDSSARRRASHEKQTDLDRQKWFQTRSKSQAIVGRLQEKFPDMLPRQILSTLKDMDGDEAEAEKVLAQKAALDERIEQLRQYVKPWADETPRKKLARFLKEADNDLDRAARKILWKGGKGVKGKGKGVGYGVTDPSMGMGYAGTGAAAASDTNAGSALRASAPEYRPPLPENAAGLLPLSSGSGGVSGIGRQSSTFGTSRRRGPHHPSPLEDSSLQPLPGRHPTLSSVGEPPELLSPCHTPGFPHTPSADDGPPSLDSAQSSRRASGGSSGAPSPSGAASPSQAGSPSGRSTRD